MRSRKIIRWAWGIVFGLLVIIAILGTFILKKIYKVNVNKSQTKEIYLLIPTGSQFDDVVKILTKNKFILDEKSFRWTAKQMKYVNKVKAGRYLLKPGMNNKDLVLLLRSGKQTPVQVVFNNIRTKEQLAKRISEQIEASESSLLNLMNDPDYTGRLGYTPYSILSMFLPDTYEFFWNTSADKFFIRMKKENDKFWNMQRLLQANLMKLSPIQVSVLASIVQMETNREDEKSVIAGVYMNRLMKNWKLEADPTLVYASGDFTLKRVLNVHKNIDSPYNTYKYKGLPPGPICLPTHASINAVLNYSNHNYMYFCAKDDFSGYHAFASNYLKHLLNARKFQKALDKRGIRT